MTATSDATAPEAATRDRLWSLLDWALWGWGLADTLREPAADLMVAALTPEMRAKIVGVMEWWEATRGNASRDRYDELTARLAALAADPDTAERDKATTAAAEVIARPFKTKAEAHEREVKRVREGWTATDRELRSVRVLMSALIAELGTAEGRVDAVLAGQPIDPDAMNAMIARRLQRVLDARTSELAETSARVAELEVELERARHGRERNVT